VRSLKQRHQAMQLQFLRLVCACYKRYACSRRQEEENVMNTQHLQQHSRSGMMNAVTYRRLAEVNMFLG